MSKDIIHSNHDGITAAVVLDEVRLTNSRVPDPSAEADDRILKVAAGALVYGDEGGGASELSDLTDVDTAGASNDDVLTYDAGAWVPKAAAGGLAEPATFTQEATFEHQLTTPPVALGNSGTINLDFAGRAFRTISNPSDALTLTTSNLAPGRSMMVRFQGGIGAVGITLPADWQFISDKPSVVPGAGAIGVLYLLSESTIDVDVIASWAQETRVPLDAREMNFQADGTIIVPIVNPERLDLGNVMHLEIDGTAGTGTLSYKKNNGADLALEPLNFSAGEVLAVTLTGSTTPSAVAIPRTTQ